MHFNHFAMTNGKDRVSNKNEMRIQTERKEMRNRNVLNHRRKADFEVADVTSYSELLQTRTAAKGKARSAAADL